MHRLAPLVAFAVMLALAGSAFADEPASQPTRCIVIRAWHGDTLAIETQVPLLAGFPATISSGDGGAPVPEGMVPPPLKINSLIGARILDDETKPAFATADQTEAALKDANRFVIGDVEIRILARDADRFAAVLFDRTVTAEHTVALPAEIAFDEEELDYLPDGVITAWVSGSLRPMDEDILIERDPRPSSVVLQKDSVPAD